MDSALKKIFEYVDQSQEKLLRTLFDLVAFQSINPCDEQGIAAQHYIASRLASLGFSVRTFESSPGIPNVVGVLEPSPALRSILLTGHIDVVPAQREEWNTPPFEAVLSDGKVFGRGTSDMKGSLAGFIIAIESVLQVSPKNMARIIYGSVFGEEVGQSGSRFFKKEGFRPDFAVLGEPARGRSLHASIGVMSLKITLNDTDRLHSGARRNFINAGGGLLAGNCIEKMATQIIPGLRELERAWGVMKIHPHVPPGQAVISPLTIQGGGEKGFNPSYCKLGVDIFYLPHENEEEVQKEVENRLQALAACDVWFKKHRLVCEWKPPAYAPAELPVEHWGFKTLQRAYLAATGKEIALGGRGAVTDAGWLREQGIPTVVYGAGDVSTAHGKNEYLCLEDLLVFTKTVAAFIYESAKGESR